MKLLSLFSGIGAFERALENLGYEYELERYCEIDKYASKAYSILHNVDEDKNLGDVTQVSGQELTADIITYGSPCTNISQAGLQQGFYDENGNKTASGLIWDAHRIIGNVKPKIAIAENVKALTTKKFEKEFNNVLDNLDKMGYNNYWQVLKASDYGVPQARERVFIVSIRKDIDKHSFSFPKPTELKTFLKDILDNNVDERFYLLDTREPHNPPCENKIINEPLLDRQGWHTYAKVVINPNGICRTLAAQCNNSITKVLVGNKIRKITARESFALMGFNKEDYDILHKEISNAQLYKMAGNSIAVNVLMEIFRRINETTLAF